MGAVEMKGFKMYHQIQQLKIQRENITV